MKAMGINRRKKGAEKNIEIGKICSLIRGKTVNRILCFTCLFGLVKRRIISFQNFIYA